VQGAPRAQVVLSACCVSLDGSICAQGLAAVWLTVSCTCVHDACNTVDTAATMSLPPLLPVAPTATRCMQRLQFSSSLALTDAQGCPLQSE
jgi:hypothetical protein